MPANTHDDGKMTIDIADWSILPEDEMLRSQMKQLLGRAIEELPEITE